MQLVHLIREPFAHPVELGRQARHLVVSLHGHGLAEVPTPHAPRRVEHLPDLPLKRAQQQDDEEERDREERRERPRDQGRRGREPAGLAGSEHGQRYSGRGIAGSDDGRPVVLAADVDVRRFLAVGNRGRIYLDSRGEGRVAGDAEHRDLTARDARRLLGELLRGRSRRDDGTDPSLRPADVDLGRSDPLVRAGGRDQRALAVTHRQRRDAQPPSKVLRRCADRAGVARSQRLGQRRVASGRARRALGLANGLVVDGQRGLGARRQPRVGLALARIVRERAHQERDGRHRQHDDKQEEQGQAPAKAHVVT